MGSLNNILPEKIDSEVEDVILEKIKSKMFSGAAMFVNAVRTIEEEFGAEGKEKIHKRMLVRALELGKELSYNLDDNSLINFCKVMEKSCAGTHEWEKIEENENKQAYRFTRCMWAEVFRSLNAADIGIWICEGDGPAAMAFNPDIKFKRTKTLMEGHEFCDHVFYIEK